MGVHPYIPNSVPEVKKDMLKAIGVKSSKELFSCIPPDLMLKRPLNLPPPAAEYDVMREIEQALSKNRTGTDLLSFLGAGCWPHFIPAVCNEINSRSEFVTAYTGDVYTDLGRYQALFEFQSMMGELVGLDAVGFPLYDWATACGDAGNMALGITGRSEIFVPSLMSPERLSVLEAHVEPRAKIRKVPFIGDTGQMDLQALSEAISNKTAAVYIENPTYLGYLESEAAAIADIAHNSGALFCVGVEPLSLGLLRAPGDYGADIVCGEGQPLGMPMAFGGALMGFLACKDDPSYISASGNRMITITSTKQEGQHGFAYVLPERTIFCSRDKAPTSTGTASALWAITAAVYLSLLGPHGIRDLAKSIMQRSHYAMKRLSKLPGVVVPCFDAVHYQEFTVSFRETGKSVREVNELLLKKGIQGGKDVSQEFPLLADTALYCVTEVHTQEDLDRLVTATEEVTG